MILLSFLVILSNVALNQATNLQLLVPLYIYPTYQNPEWQAVADASKQISVVAVINPASGPGQGLPNTDYQAGLKKLVEAGVFLLGYVPTTYGMRNISLVKADVQSYASWPKEYRVSGIFFDEASTDVNLVGYYRELYQYSRKLFGCFARILTNQGVNVDEAFVGKNRATDTAVVFEDYQSNWVNYKPQSYMKNHADIEFATIIHTCKESDMKSAIDKAVASNIGYVYVTDDIMNNPYDQLPTYFKNEVDYIASL